MNADDDRLDLTRRTVPPPAAHRRHQILALSGGGYRGLYTQRDQRLRPDVTPRDENTAQSRRRIMGGTQVEDGASALLPDLISREEETTLRQPRELR